MDAIITTTGTVLADDPELTSKEQGKDPAIFVVGKREISPNSKLIKRGADLTLVKEYGVDQWTLNRQYIYARLIYYRIKRIGTTYNVAT